MNYQGKTGSKDLQNFFLEISEKKILNFGIYKDLKEFKRASKNLPPVCLGAKGTPRMTYSMSWDMSRVSELYNNVLKVLENPKKKLDELNLYWSGSNCTMTYYDKSTKQTTRSKEGRPVSIYIDGRDKLNRQYLYAVYKGELYGLKKKDTFKKIITSLGNPSPFYLVFIYRLLDKPIDQNLINVIKIADELHFEELSKYAKRNIISGKKLALFNDTRKPLNNFLENKYAKKPKIVAKKPEQPEKKKNKVQIAKKKEDKKWSLFKKKETPKDKLKTNKQVVKKLTTKKANKNKKVVKKNKEPVTVVDYIKEIGVYTKPAYYPAGMKEYLKIKCNIEKFSCVKDKATRKMAQTFKRGPKYHDRHPGEIIYGMALFEIFYLKQLEKEEKYVMRFLDLWNNSNKSKIQKTNQMLLGDNVIRMLKLSKARKNMRNALGMSLETSPEEAIASFWALGEFLEKGKIKKIKITKGAKKRRVLLTKYQKTVGNFKSSLQKRKEEEIYKKINPSYNVQKEFFKKFKSKKK